jgi:hypothetical protein
MDKPVPFWFILFTIVLLIGSSFLIYKWFENIKIKDENDNS